MSTVRKLNWKIDNIAQYCNILATPAIFKLEKQQLTNTPKNIAHISEESIFGQEKKIWGDQPFRLGTYWRHE